MNETWGNVFLETDVFVVTVQIQSNDKVT